MKAKVMIVDDTEAVRELIGKILHQAGYEAMPKVNAAELLASFTEAQPDIVLLDLGLPDGDGMDLLPKIKIETVVPDARKDEVTHAISTAARSGKIGDGKIFVFDVAEAIRIRNDDTGELAL